MAKRASVLFLFTAVVAGCSTGWFGPSVVAPDVRIADLELVGSGLFEQRYRVDLHVVNPNDFDLPLDGLRFALELNDKPFARGVTSQGITVPRLGDAHVTVEATTSTLDIVRQVLELGRSEVLAYDLEGTAFLSGGLGRSVDFAEQGSLELLPAEAVHRLVPSAPQGR